LDTQLEQRLSHATGLPTLPAVAMKVIGLARDPDASLAQIAGVISQDPALVAKILRIANSPFYALRRRCENLRQALSFLGLNGTLALALSFSMVKALGQNGRSTFDYRQFWRRSLLSAAACRALAERVAPGTGEELFLAALLQDIGMLALDRAFPGFYAPLKDGQSAHDELVSFEHERLGTDHAEVGAWLLHSWHIPSRLRDAVAASHRPETGPGDRTHMGCVCVSGRIADVWLAPERQEALKHAEMSAKAALSLDGDAVRQTIEAVATQLPEMESLFEVDLGDTSLMESILDEAKEAQALRNLELVREVSEIHQSKESLESRTRELEERSRRDALTAVFNRGHLDRVLAEEFKQAQLHGWTLTVAFADLDHFKKVNDQYGHHTGDQVLAAAAQLLTDNTRGGDVIGRYGGEEFVLVLPGTGAAAAEVVCKRLVAAFARTRHDVAGKQSLVVTISIGVATHGEAMEFGSVDQLVQAADRALYTAKLKGRNQAVSYHPN